MNVYDFDKTVYLRDSSIDFYLYNVKRDLKLLRFLPQQSIAMIRYKLKRITKTQMKQSFYVYMRSIENIDGHVLDFWETHQIHLQTYYLAQKKEDDVIISASPTFLLQPLIDKWNCVLIASVVDPKTGHSEENCWGEEKVHRFALKYPLDSIDEFYSDSLSDTPLAKHAKKAFLVTGTQIDPWPNN